MTKGLFVVAIVVVLVVLGFQTHGFVLDSKHSTT
jgi:hypothetical protein